MDCNSANKQTDDDELMSWNMRSRLTRENMKFLIVPTVEMDTLLLYYNNKSVDYGGEI